MPQSRPRKIENLNLEEVKYKRLVEKKTLEQVAQETGCSTMTMSRFCRQHKIPNLEKEKRHYKDLAGRQFGRLKVIRMTKGKSDYGVIWECQCECGKIIERVSARLVHGSDTNQSCGCFSVNHNFRGCGDLSGSYFNQIRRGAGVRDLEFTITKEYAWDLFEKQGRKCALTGIDILLVKNHRRKGRANQTASIDRIDSSKGYTPDNIQWVHKDLQPMKWDLTDEVFVDWCRMVANYHPLATSKTALSSTSN